MPHPSGRTPFHVVFLALCLIAFPAFGSPFRVEAASRTQVYGKVVDSATGEPIYNAKVVFHRIERQFESRAWTDSSGNYELSPEVYTWISYWAFSFCNRSSTPGFDYVPALRKNFVEEDPLNVSFTLLPGASICVVGDFGSFESPPMKRVSFTVVDQYGLLNETDALTKYGFQPSPNSSILMNMGLDTQTIVVPANTPVKVEADVIYSGGSRARFAIPGGDNYIALAQGDQLTINLRILWMSIHPDYLPSRLQSLLVVVNEAEKAGFYISYEKNRVRRAENLVDAGQSALDEGRYESAYADLHEAYYVIKDTEKALSSMFVNASQSVWLLYLLYPGYNALQKSAYNPWAYTPFEGLLTPLLAFVSFLAALFVIQGLPHRFKEKTSLERLRPMSALTAAFSVAARYLKRRKLRTLLTSIFMLTSVFAFITLTSLSFEYGFAIQPHHGQALSEGFLLRKP